MLRIFTRSMSSGKSVRPPIRVFGIEGRYVTALFSAAHQMNQLEGAEKALRSFQKEVSKPKMVDFIETSFISRQAKAKLLNEVASSAGMPSSVGNFLGIVAENGRLKLLRKMITMFLAVMVAHRKEALCEVITANPLDGDTRNSLMDALKKLTQGKNITLTEKVDPSIIGGMIVGIEDKHIDMSIAKKILMYTDILQQSI